MLILLSITVCIAPLDHLFWVINPEPSRSLYSIIRRNSEQWNTLAPCTAPAFKVIVVYDTTLTSAPGLFDNSVTKSSGGSLPGPLDGLALELFSWLDNLFQTWLVMAQ